MTASPYPKTLDEWSVHARQSVDPFWSTLTYFRVEDIPSLEEAILHGDPRRRAIIPTVMLHPQVDLAFLSRVVDPQLRRTLGYLARIAMELVEKTPAPEEDFFQDRYASFLNFFREKRKQTLDVLSHEEGLSPFPRYRFEEFSRIYKIYAHHVHYGRTTSTLS